MAEHPFLSQHWIIAAREIHIEFAGRIAEPEESLRLNVTVIAAPFDSGEVLGHVDTTTGSAIPNEGHLDGADVSVRVPYEIARQLLVNQEFETLMISFMSGEIEVEGDITRLLSLSDRQPTLEQQALAEEVVGRLKAITA